MNVRKANSSDMNSVYLMGADVWSDGLSQEEYLSECRGSLKYKKGVWYILEKERVLLSSLILYSFGRNTFGIGSLATPIEFRKLGYASHLVQKIIGEIDSKTNDSLIFLYADICPDFYEKFGFVKLHSSLQHSNQSCCMLRSQIPRLGTLNIEEVPRYF